MTAVQAGEPRCDICGEPLDGADRFCTHCGAPIAGPTAQSRERARKRKWRRRRRVIGVLVFLAVVVVLGVVITTSVSDDSPSDSASSSTSSSSTTTTVPPPAGPFKVITGVNIRSGPGPNFPVIALIETGNTVMAICVVPDGQPYDGPAGPATSWLRVQSQAPSAWVASPYVATGGAVDDPKVIPVCTAAQRT